MSTRSNIAQVSPDGSVKALYVHFDGYLDGVGQTLVNWLGGQTLERRKFIIDKLMAERIGWSALADRDIDLAPAWSNYDSKKYPNYDDYMESPEYKAPQSYTARGEADDGNDGSFGSLDHYLSQRDNLWTEFIYLFGADYNTMAVYASAYPETLLRFKLLGVIDLTSPDLNEEIAGHRKDIRLILGVSMSEEEE